MNKIKIKKQIVDSLNGQEEIEKIIIFGSFNNSETPNDIDIAVIQNSSENYLTLAMKYRKLIRNVRRDLEIPIDIFPIDKKNQSSYLFNEIASGEVIYEKRN